VNLQQIQKIQEFTALLNTASALRKTLPGVLYNIFPFAHDTLTNRTIENVASLAHMASVMLGDIIVETATAHVVYVRRDTAPPHEMWSAPGVAVITTVSPFIPRIVSRGHNQTFKLLSDTTEPTVTIWRNDDEQPMHGQNPLRIDHGPNDPRCHYMPESDHLEAFSTHDAAMAFAEKRVDESVILDMSSYGHPAVIEDWWRKKKEATPTP
jgi:hypothetical protein